VAEGVPTGREAAGDGEGFDCGEGEFFGCEAAGVAEGEPAGREAAGVAVGFVCTCTSAAKRDAPPSRAAAVRDQILGMTAYATHCKGFRKVNSRRNERREPIFAKKSGCPVLTV
jgi:hypothetical protein